jgi:hypothetical protein
MATFSRDKTIQIKMINIVPNSAGGILTYVWTVNGLTQNNNTDTLILLSNNLNLGDNQITMRILNACGTWSITQAETITVTQVPSTVSSISIVLGKTSLVVDEATTAKATAYTASGAIVPKVPIQWTWTPTDLITIVPNIYTDTDVISTITAVKKGTCIITAITELGVSGTANINVGATCTAKSCAFNAQ